MNVPSFQPSESSCVVDSFGHLSRCLGGLLAALASYSLVYGAPPINDQFVNRTILEGADVRDQASNVEATWESVEKDHGGFSGASYLAKSVWWQWMAPSNGIVVIDTDESTFDTVMAVYVNGNPDAGVTLGDLKAIAASDNINDINTRSRVRFPVTAGRHYQIAVDSSAASGQTGDIVLQIKFSSDPQISGLNLTSEASVVNDRFEDRVLLTGTNVSAIAYNLTAGWQSGEKDHGVSVGSGYLAKSVWWAWVAPGNGRATVHTAGSTRSNGNELDTLLAVYSGDTIGGLRLIAANDNIDQFIRTSMLSIPVTVDRIYQIVVDGNATSDQVGNIILNIQFDPIPEITNRNITTEATVENDFFADRILLTGTNVSAIGYNAGATWQSGENHMSTYASKSLWWAWRADSGEEVTIDTQGSSFNTIVAVYTGDQIFQLKQVALNDDAEPFDPTSLVRFFPTPGEYYQIAVDGSTVGPSFGSIVLNIRQGNGLSQGQLRSFHAVGIEFNPTPGKKYRLQRSADLSTWTFEGDPFIGGDEPYRLMIPTEGRLKEEFRFIEVP